MVDINKELAENIRGVRKSKGIEQGEVAKYLGIAQGSYSRFESGQVRISVERIQKLCMFLGIKVEIEFFSNGFCQVRVVR